MPNDNVTVLPARQNRTEEPPRRRSARRVLALSLPLLLRGAPAALQPDQVARDLLDRAQGDNDAARPLWREQKAAFAAEVAKRGVRGAPAWALCDQWIDAVRDAGIAEKARRRQAEERRLRDAEAFFDALRRGEA